MARSRRLEMNLRRIITSQQRGVTIGESTPAFGSRREARSTLARSSLTPSAKKRAVIVGGFRSLKTGKPLFLFGKRRR